MRAWPADTPRAKRSEAPDLDLQIARITKRIRGVAAYRFAHGVGGTTCGSVTHRGDEHLVDASRFRCSEKLAVQLVAHGLPLPGARGRLAARTAHAAEDPAV